MCVERGCLMRVIVCVLLSLQLGLAFAQGGKVYKITNPDGSVSYTDQPPVGKGTGARELPVAPATSGIRSVTASTRDGICIRRTW